MSTEIREWVRSGGRLIFLDRDHPNTIMTRNYELTRQGGREMNRYVLGYGEFVTGRAAPITNRILMYDSDAGTEIWEMLSNWNAEREIGTIFFAEYYHGFRGQDGGFVRQFPLIVRLLFLQIVIIAVVVVWHLGKRYGNAVPYYEEVERTENEYVHALAQLYMRAKKGDGKK
jgi:hypothetical protein